MLSTIKDVCDKFDIEDILLSGSLSLQTHKLLLTKDKSEILQSKTTKNQEESTEPTETGTTESQAETTISLSEENTEMSEICQTRATENQEETASILPEEKTESVTFPTIVRVKDIAKTWLENAKKTTRISKDSNNLIKIMSQPGIKMVYKDTMKGAVRTFQTSVQKAVTKQQMDDSHDEEFREAVVNYLKALCERDLKIVRNLILQHLLCKKEKQEEPDQTRPKSNSQDPPDKDTPV